MSLPTDVEADLVDAFEEFYRTYYRDEIGELYQHHPDERSLWITTRDLYRWNPDVEVSSVLDVWLERPREIQALAEEALQNYDFPLDIELDPVHVRLTDPDGVLEEHAVPELNSDDVERYVAVSGKLAKVTGTKPRLKTGVFICQRCTSESRIPQPRTELREPHQCQGCERQGPFKIDFGESELVDQRKVKLEEPPAERAKGEGQHVPVYVDDDLCDIGGENGLTDRGGENCTIFGQLRLDESNTDGPEFDVWLDAHAIEFEEEDLSDIDIETHREAFEEFAARDDAVELCRDSIAPGLKGDDDLDTVLEAGVAWLFNAYRVDPEDAGSKRGDLHMGVFGDPGLGKSTLLGALHELAPRSEFRSGTGLSAVGLTAAAVQEEFAGKTEWTLQPGILPRTDGGHCIIDEVDDVVDEKTKKMHDALEGEQMVKVDKAGIKADLPTRTAILVSGNPTHGRFDRYGDIAEQIDLDPALIDRMDLLFALQDVVVEERDREKARHILDTYDELSREDLSERGELPADEDATREVSEGPVPKEVLRAWIAYARENVFPLLTEPAKERLLEFYVETRNLNDAYENEEGGDSATSVTPRSLEAGIRLSIAFARVRLSETVDLEDAERSINISKQVVGLNFDPETGEFDAGRTERKSQSGRVKAMRNVLQNASEDLSIDRLAERSGVPEDKVEHRIQEWLKSGDVMEPQVGEYRWVD